MVMGSTEFSTIFYKLHDSQESFDLCCLLPCNIPLLFFLMREINKFAEYQSFFFFFLFFMLHDYWGAIDLYYLFSFHFLMWWETWIYREPSKHFRPSNSYYYCCCVKKTHDSKLYSGTHLDQSKPSNTHFLWPATSQFNTYPTIINRWSEFQEKKPWISQSLTSGVRVIRLKWWYLANSYPH